jgi:hypothetical protein
LLEEADIEAGDPTRRSKKARNSAVGIDVSLSDVA